MTKRTRDYIAERIHVLRGLCSKGKNCNHAIRKIVLITYGPAPDKEWSLWEPPERECSYSEWADYNLDRDAWTLFTTRRR
jgi:hypothetical protein